MDVGVGGTMRRPALGIFLACLVAGEAASAEGAAEAIRAFGLIGTWSIDCSRDPIATCNGEKGCGARTTYEVTSSGQPMIKNVVGTLVPGAGKSFETVIEQASLLPNDKIRIISVQQGLPGEVSKLAWTRQPGERWETVLVKEGNGYRTFSAHSDDGKKIYVEDGLIHLPPRDTRPDQIPSNWVRSDRKIPPFERCRD